ncbi:universal stress protein [Salinigranum halophilum]|jgi:nucleotide-binding universal stress UspA family protein|uniref:universal stress protein n=1 Tax=Salinigranum halophilum TaxID=2565931 RepID=UPI0010A85B09|nr:universal stress protein [Salinigranum halophilum]
MGDLALVAYDGSPLAQRALEYALRKFPDDDLLVFYVVDPVYAVYEAEFGGPAQAKRWPDDVADASTRLLEEAKSTAADHAGDVTTASATGKPERRILEAVDEYDADAVVMGSHGRTGVSRLVMGSTAEAVMRHSPVPVTVVR